MFLKQPLFQKRRWSCNFSAKKRWHSPPPPPPRWIVLGLSPLLPQRLYRWAGGRTLASQPKFLGAIGYQICLAVWRPLKHVLMMKRRKAIKILKEIKRLIEG